jgi:hypothetical protein
VSIYTKDHTGYTDSELREDLYYTHQTTTSGQSNVANFQLTEPTGTTTVINYWVVGYDTTGDESYAAHIVVRCHEESSADQEFAQTIVYEDKTSGFSGLSADMLGTGIPKNGRIRVPGIASSTINWVCFLTYQNLDDNA